MRKTNKVLSNANSRCARGHVQLKEGERCAHTQDLAMDRSQYGSAALEEAMILFCDFPCGIIIAARTVCAGMPTKVGSNFTPKNDQGRLVVKHKDLWGTVCADHEETVRVACKEMSYLGARVFLAKKLMG